MRPFKTVLVCGFVLLVAGSNVGHAGEGGTHEGLKLVNPEMIQQLGGNSSVLKYVGFLPGHTADNYWSVWSGIPGPAQPEWNWEPPYSNVHGDAMQGWWPIRSLYTSSSGATVNDSNRPWWALDYGNNANYSAPGVTRTFGVTGVWHRDNGSVSGGGVAWSPLSGNFSAWMGLRRHGDLAAVAYDDPARGGTGNYVNADVMQFNGLNAIARSGNDKKFPGYGSQMDQLLYRDIDMSGNPSASLSITFLYRTQLSTQYVTAADSRTGWFQHDPIAVIVGSANPNYIESTGAASPPADSFMVYVGAPAEGSVILSDGNFHTITDPKRRWFGEVIRSNEGLYIEKLSKGGINALTNFAFTLSHTDLASILAVSSNKVRLVFRVKTNRRYDDEDYCDFSSNGVGAAIVDDVSYGFNGPANILIGSFESNADINNDTAVPATTAWKSTGRPPRAMYHTAPLIGLIYQDLCGQPGNPARVCNMTGSVVSSGDPANGELSTASNSFGTAEQEIAHGMISPTIQLTGPFTGLGSTNRMGLTAGDASNVEYSIDGDLYVGWGDMLNQGIGWRFGAQSYPANQPDGTPDWGQIRVQPYLDFDPESQCMSIHEPLFERGLIRTSKVTGYPDSLRLYVGTVQQTFRFGISQSEAIGGLYWDNLKLGISPTENRVTADLWHWINDTFSFNDDASLVGTPAAFDTTTALVKSGLNIAPFTTSTNRYNVPGDTTVVIAEGENVRVDLVFRILPGPGNYVTIGQPSSGLRDYRVHGVTGLPIPAPGTGAQTNFWSQYLSNAGPAAGGSPAYNGAARPVHVGSTWNPNVWNIARMDTAELNLFQMHGRDIVQPESRGLFMTTYHEAEWTLRAGLLVPRNICFIASLSNTAPTSAVICTGGDATYPDWPPSYTSNISSGYSSSAPGNQTYEGTKIIPDGVLTPGAHVEYFVRRQDGSDPNVFLAPDTNRVTPQTAEESIDAHRWQEFGVLPDRWKSASYTHPVLGTFGQGEACMLYLDECDRRGNERVWTGIADSIGATFAAKWGAHNGWSAPGKDIPGRSKDPNDPVNFIAKHIGQPGRAWDMLGVKGGEGLDVGAGSLGSRGGIGGYSFSNPANPQINGKTSRIGPSAAMLNTYYTILMGLTADLSSGILGPFMNKSQNDIKIIEDFLLSGPTSAIKRGALFQGSGFVESNDQSAAGYNLLCNYLGVYLREYNYLTLSGNTHPYAKNVPTAEIDPILTDLYLVNNACTHANDVLDRCAALAAETAVASFYEATGFNAPYISGVDKHYTTTHPWVALTNGWDIAQFGGWAGFTGPPYPPIPPFDPMPGNGRLAYYYNAFSSVFADACDPVQGPPLSTTDTPDVAAASIDFLKVENSPLRAGSVTVEFGLSGPARISAKVHDVSGRRVRTLADRAFPGGTHSLKWDGTDDRGKALARGVYFVSLHRGNGRLETRRVVILR